MLIFIKETIRFNMVYELSSLFATEERSAVRCIFNRQFRGLLFESCSNRVVGTCQTCYRYYCPSLLTVLQLYVLPRTLSTESASKITVIQSDINVNVATVTDLKGKLFKFSALNDHPINLF